MTETKEKVLTLPIAQQVKVLLDDPTKWIQCGAGDINGPKCLGGAIAVAAGHLPEEMYHSDLNQVMYEFAVAAGIEVYDGGCDYDDGSGSPCTCQDDKAVTAIFEYNDYGTYEDVVEAIDRAIASLEGDE